MRLMRRSRARLAALLSAGVTAMPLAGCTSGGPATAGSSALAGGPVLACGDSIGDRAPPAPMRIVLGVVGLPASPGYPALQTGLTGDGDGARRLYAKTGLVIRAGTTFELVVPAGFAGRLGIGWGHSARPAPRIVVRDCPGPGGGWLAYAGGYWIDHPACVPIIVKAGGRQQEVHIGLGTPCPGQRPPQGPSQS